MIVNKYFISVLILWSMVVIPSAYSAADSTVIRITGSSSAVGIKDILSRKSGVLSESDIKKICADITGRYHDRGYTAFYIEKAVRNEDGTVDIFFKESVVSGVTVTGMDDKVDDAALSIYIKGELFNEFILKENIIRTKKRYNLKQLNAVIRRGDDGNIIISASVSSRIHELYSALHGSPVYGVSPALAYRISYGGFLAGISAESSFNQGDRSYSRGSVFFNSDNVPGNSYYTLAADVFDKKDSYTDKNELIYRHKSISPEAGFSSFYGAAGLGVFITGTFDELDDYPDEDGGVSFSGVKLKLNYDDSSKKMTYGDMTKGEVELYSGWNAIEEKITTRLVIDYMMNFPVFTDFFISLNGHFFYTSDNERFTRVYVFDSLLACRSDDFSSASWRNISGIDFNYEIVKRTLYFGPVFKWGVYNADSYNNVFAAGMKLLFTTGKIRMEASYLYDTGYGVKNGLLMFSAAAVY